MNLIEKLDIKELKINEDAFTAFIELDEFHAQPHGFLNGGVTLAFAEIIAGMASLELLEDNQYPVGQSIGANHLNSMKSEGKLFAFGKLLKKGKRNHVWEIKMKDENNLLISEIIFTNAILNK